MPPARGADVLMTILCWTVPVEEVLNGVLAAAAAGLGVADAWVLNRPLVCEG